MPRVIRRLRRCARYFWGSLAIVLVVLAAAVSLGRQALPLLNDYRTAIAEALSKQMGVQVQLGAIEGSWRGLRPRLKLQQVQVSSSSGVLIVAADTIETQVDLPSLLWDWRIALRKLTFSGLSATFVQSEEGRWALNGLPFSQAKQNDFDIRDPLDIFLFGRRIQLQNSHFNVNFYSGQVTQVSLPAITLENDDDFHRLSAAFSVDKDQRALSFVMEGTGDPRDQQHFDARGYLQLERFPMEKVLAATAMAAWQRQGSGNWSDGSRMDLKLWFDGNLHKGFNLKGQLQADDLPLKLPPGMTLPERTQANVFGHWQLNDGWQIQLGQLAFSWPDLQSPPLNVAISGKPGSPLVLAIEQIDLKAWCDVAAQAGASNEVLKALHPEGSLKSVQVTLTTPEQGYFDLKAQVQDLAIHSANSSPEFHQVNGYLQATASAGSFDLDSRNGYSMHFPMVYREPLTYDTAKGQLRWAVDKASDQLLISSSRLSLRGPDGDAEGYFGLNQPLHKTATSEPLMTLLIGLKNSQAAYHKKYVPYAANENLQHWLDVSVKAGHLIEGAFVYHGSLLRQPLTARSMQLYLNVDNAELQFEPHWPAITQGQARLLMDNAELEVNLDSGQLQGNQLSNTLVKLVREEGLGLEITGNMSGTSENALQLLLNSPIKALVGDGLQQLKLTGPVTGSVNLRVPLVAGGPNRQAVQVHLNENQLQLPAINLTLEQLSSDLYYTNDKGLHTERINGSLWGKPLQAKISTDTAKGNTLVDFKGPVSMASLRQWLKRPELAYAQGQATVAGQLVIPGRAQATPLQLTLNSDLRGVALALPQPFAKAAADVQDFSGLIQIDPVNQEDRYQLAFSDLADLTFTRKQGELASFGLRLGTAPVLRPSANAILVEAHLPTANLAEWQPFVLGYAALLSSQPSDSAEAAALTHWPLDLRINLDRGDWGETHFEPLAVRAQQLPISGWEFGFNTPMAGGRLTYGRPQQANQLHLDYLHLPEDPQSKSHEGQCTPYNTSGPFVLPPSKMTDFDPAIVPPLEVAIDQIRLGKEDVGQLNFHTRPVAGGVTLDPLRGTLYGMTLSGFSQPDASLSWTRQGNQHQTQFDGILKTGNLANVFVKMGDPPAISSETAKFNLHLGWPGAPDQGGMANMSGFATFDVVKGRFIQGASAGSNPLLKLISFLNFDNLSRRLRFDFADLNPQGMAFDTLRGRVDYNAGTLRFAEPIQVTSASTHIQLAGTVDVASQQVNANLVATLPITGNLTLAAAMTGALPVAAGVYLASKVFKKQLDKASSLRYQVRGPWVEPELSLQSIFDDQTIQEVKPKPIKPLRSRKQP